MRFHTTLNDRTITFCTSKLLTGLLNVFTIKVTIYRDIEFELCKAFTDLYLFSIKRLMQTNTP